MRKKHLVYFVMLVSLAVMLVSCSSDPKEANKDNFKKAAQAYLDQKFHCTVAYSNFPVQKEIFGDSKDKAMHALTLAGLVKEKIIKETPASGEGFFRVEKQTVYEYDLTEEGKKYYIPDVEKTLGGTKVGAIRFGKAQVVDIENFTTPAVMLGMNVSRVTYTYAVSDIPGWIKKEEILKALDDPKITAAVNSEKTPVKETDAFIQTEQGWVHEKLFKQ